MEVVHLLVEVTTQPGLLALQSLHTLCFGTFTDHSRKGSELTPIHGAQCSLSLPGWLPACLPVTSQPSSSAVTAALELSLPDSLSACRAAVLDLWRMCAMEMKGREGGRQREEGRGTIFGYGARPAVLYYAVPQSTLPLKIWVNP